MSTPSSVMGKCIVFSSHQYDIFFLLHIHNFTVTDLVRRLVHRGKDGLSFIVLILNCSAYNVMIIGSTDTSTLCIHTKSNESCSVYAYNT